MASTIATVTFDCANPARAQDFWAAALGYEKDSCTTEWSLLKDPAGTGPTLVFNKVPEEKTAKNRVHLDLEHDDPESESRRLVALGASVMKPFDTWIVMRDPEGNEFCVVRRG